MSAHNFIDLTGQRFGRYVVQFRDKEKESEVASRLGKCNSTYWRCICDCGNVVSVCTSNLRSGKASGCVKCMKHDAPQNFIDLTGKTFGRLKVISRAEIPITVKSRWGTYWNCLCECGNIVVVQSGKLISGHTKSCGCYQKDQNSNDKFIDISGKKFGKLTVLSRNLEQRGDGQTYWDCICDCGNKVTVNGAKLKRFHTSSCGCIKSYGNFVINNLLQTNFINSKSEFSFPDLFGVGGGKLKYDFAVFDKDFNLQYLIEFDGSIHFDGSQYALGDFEARRKHDLMKNEYCFKNKIPIIRIPYTETYTLSLDLLQLSTTPYLLTPSNESEYYSKYSFANIDIQ